uniref:Uncharacterized protein n=1 Tax=Mesocestoides corti TaxID=53468 RepID=A0A5K3EV41_MESCO
MPVRVTQARNHGMSQALVGAHAPLRQHRSVMICTVCVCVGVGASLDAIIYEAATAATTMAYTERREGKTGGGGGVGGGCRADAAGPWKAAEKGRKVVSHEAEACLRLAQKPRPFLRPDV